MPPQMLPELLEQDATGRIAEIYAEIRTFSGVPYVSSLQRYLATMPGVLEWAWDAVRPALATGAIQKTGWRLAEAARITPAAPISAAALRVWGVDAAGLQSIRNIAENFVRVSPVNLMTGATLRLLLTGTKPGGGTFPTGWTPPEMLPPMPGNANPEKLTPDTNAVLMQLATELDGAPFIPALYRQLAHWPGFLAWLATELAPRFTADETNVARANFRQSAWDAATDIAARLPALPTGPVPSPPTIQRVLTAIDRYAGTSPEMCMFGRLILQAVPNSM